MAVILTVTRAGPRCVLVTRDRAGSPPPSRILAPTRSGGRRRRRWGRRGRQLAVPLLPGPRHSAPAPARLCGRQRPANWRRRARGAGCRATAGRERPVGAAAAAARPGPGLAATGACWPRRRARWAARRSGAVRPRRFGWWGPSKMRRPKRRGDGGSSAAMAGTGRAEPVRVVPGRAELCWAVPGWAGRQSMEGPRFAKGCRRARPGADRSASDGHLAAAAAAAAAASVRPSRGAGTGCAGPPPSPPCAPLRSWPVGGRARRRAAGRRCAAGWS